MASFIFKTKGYKISLLKLWALCLHSTVVDLSPGLKASTEGVESYQQGPERN